MPNQNVLEQKKQKKRLKITKNKKTKKYNDKSKLNTDINQKQKYNI